MGSSQPPSYHSCSWVWRIGPEGTEQRVQSIIFSIKEDYGAAQGHRAAKLTGLSQGLCVALGLAPPTLGNSPEAEEAPQVGCGGTSFNVQLETQLHPLFRVPGTLGGPSYQKLL